MKQGDKHIAIILLILSIFAGPAAHAGTLRKGLPFMQARIQLIKDGWHPVNIHTGEHYEYIGTETVLIDSHIYELESCAVDRPLCVFNYHRGKRCLRLVTHGEELSDMRVESWSFRCPTP